MSKTHISELKVSKPIISIFASGNSINDLTDEDKQFIYDHSFLITINYAPLKLKSHLNIHSDKIVTDALAEHFIANQKECAILSRIQAFSIPKQGEAKPSHLFIHSLVDYWFDTAIDKLKGNYTIVWLCQMMERWFSDKKILIFGLDMYAPNNDYCKWYDVFTNHDKRTRVKEQLEKIRQSGEQLNKLINTKGMFLNCNPNSRYDGFAKINDWKKELM